MFPCYSTVQNVQDIIREKRLQNSLCVDGVAQKGKSGGAISVARAVIFPRNGETTALTPDKDSILNNFVAQKSEQKHDLGFFHRSSLGLRKIHILTF